MQRIDIQGHSLADLRRLKRKLWNLIELEEATLADYRAYPEVDFEIKIRKIKGANNE